jgi:hypothetical protein
MNEMPKQFCLAFYDVSQAWVHYLTYWVDVDSGIIFERKSHLYGYEKWDAGDLMLRAFDSQHTAPPLLGRDYNDRTLNRWATSASQLKAHEKGITTNGKTVILEQFENPQSRCMVVFESGTPIRFEALPVDFVSGRLHDISRQPSPQQLMVRDILRKIKNKWYGDRATDYLIDAGSGDVFARLFIVFKTMSSSQIVYKLRKSRMPKGRRKLARLIFEECGNKTFTQTTDKRHEMLARILGVTLNLPSKADLRELREWQNACAGKTIARIARKIGSMSESTRRVLQMMAFKLNPPHPL